LSASESTTAVPFVEIGARSTAPVVLSCEHASRTLPVRFDLDPGLRRILASHWGWDPGAWTVTREIARQLATSAVAGRWSRLWIDLNRRVDDPTLIRERCGNVALPWNRDVGSAERERRVLDVHAPYHERIDRLIVRRVVRGVRPLLLAVHTYTPVLGRSRRAYDAGVLYERDRGPARILCSALREAGLGVRYNEPYSGLAGMMYAVDRHGKHHDLPCLELELNQALFERRGAARELGRIVTAGLERVVSYGWRARTASPP
jgi:predicted N-formylglutamate amidohydrolase